MRTPFEPASVKPASVGNVHVEMPVSASVEAPVIVTTFVLPAPGLNQTVPPAPG